MKRIGLIIERHWHYGRRICEGIAAFSREHGGFSLEFPVQNKRGVIGNLKEYDGIIARVWGQELSAQLLRSGRPVVDVYGGEPNPAFTLVDQNARLIGQLAARHFIEHRFPRFAFCGYACQRYSVLRRTAFVRALELSHFQCDIFEDTDFSAEEFGRKILGHGDFDFGINRNKLATWLKRLEKPVAVFCAHDLVALNVVKVCEAVGLRVPQDVAILGVDDDPLLCDFTNPTISSIDPNPQGIGYAAASALAAWIEHPENKPKDSHPAPLGLTERASTQVYPFPEPWLSDALVFIRRNITRNINSGDVFAFLGLSHTTVERAFKRRLGSTVRQEIAKVRIDEAKRLLAKTSIPLSEVASRSGFSSSAYFTAAFNAATGRTPLKWRSSFSPPTSACGSSRSPRR